MEKNKRLIGAAENGDLEKVKSLFGRIEGAVVRTHRSAITGKGET